MFLYLSDVGTEGGPLAVVPGSAKLPLGPLETLRQSFKSSMTLDATLRQDQMPNHYKFVSCHDIAAVWVAFLKTAIAILWLTGGSGWDGATFRVSVMRLGNTRGPSR